MVIATQRKAQRAADFPQAQRTELRHPLSQPSLRNRDCIMQIHVADLATGLSTLDASGNGVQVCIQDHSYRSATDGSTLAALRAGI